jgi:hypothetical protein
MEAGSGSFPLVFYWLARIGGRMRMGRPELVAIQPALSLSNGTAARRADRQKTPLFSPNLLKISSNRCKSMKISANLSISLRISIESFDIFANLHISLLILSSTFAPIAPTSYSLRIVLSHFVVIL